MAPKRGLSIERTSEYEDFMKELTVFHEKRGYVTSRDSCIPRRWY